jgi:hypothetical protein
MAETVRRKLKLAGVLHTVPAYDEVPLKDVLLFDSQAEDLGIPERWVDVEEAAVYASQLDPKNDQHAALAWARGRQNRVLVAATIWLTLRHAGKDVTLSEATEITPSQIEFVDPPKDHRPKKAAARKSTRTSGRAAGARASK